MTDGLYIDIYLKLVHSFSSYGKKVQTDRERPPSLKPSWILNTKVKFRKLVNIIEI